MEQNECWQESYLGKTCLVTGSSGVIGQHLVAILKYCGANVIGVDRRESSATDVVMDLLTVHKLPKHDILFHLAAVFGRLVDSDNMIQDSFRNNVALSHHLMTIVDSPHIVFASSYLVYSSQVGHIRCPIKESSPIGPRNIVGAAKYFTEQELLARKLPACLARITRVYGEGCNSIVSRLVRGEYPERYYGLNNGFDYIYAGDVAEGLARLGATRIIGPVNLSYGANRTPRDILNCLGINPKSTLPLEDRAEGYESIDNSLLVYLTGWEPMVDLEQGINLLRASYYG